MQPRGHCAQQHPSRERTRGWMGSHTTMDRVRKSTGRRMRSEAPKCCQPYEEEDSTHGPFFKRACKKLPERALSPWLSTEEKKI
eukprot:1141580-Pelagomonas_calceolata.AAC.1